MSATIVRQMAMLKLIKPHPIKISTRAIQEQLLSSGFEVTQRTIQRDLKNLSKVLAGLETDANPDVAGWYWNRNTEINIIPGIDRTTALSFKLVETFLEDQVPPAELERLRPYFCEADRVLGHEKETGYANWTSKIQIVPRSQPLISALVNEDVIQTVYAALFDGKQFRGRYRRRDGDEAEYDLHPLGLVFQKSVVYLVASVWNYGIPRHFAMHRFMQCTPIAAAANVPDDFDLEKYVRQGSFEYVDQDAETMQFEALFENRTAQHLQETPLSDDQVLSLAEEGWTRVAATVKNTLQLRWWLLGFGDRAVVLQPEGLREEFAKIAQSMSKSYE